LQDDGCRTASEPSPKIDDGCRTASEPTPKACLRQKPCTTARELPSEATELVSAQKPQDYAPSRTSSEKTTEIMIKRTMERTVTEEDLHTAEPVRTPAGLEDAGCKTASLPEPVEAKQLHQPEVEKHTERERQTATVDDECRTASELMPAQDDGCRTASEPTPRAVRSMMNHNIFLRT
ncbi:hypothetical protein COOONC_20209, partial [Cooperia oncophora]